MTIAYRLTHAPTVVELLDDGGIVAHSPSDDVYYRAWLADGNAPLPAAPSPPVYTAVRHVDERLRTTDAVPVEVFRFPCGPKTIYSATLTIAGIDAVSGAVKAMEGRFVWKRLTGNAIMTGITVVSDIHDAAAAAWAPNAAPSGTDIVFTVAGAAGRTIDWQLIGEVGRFAPEGS